MTRTTRKTLEALAARLGELTGRDYYVDRAYGANRLAYDNGARWASPRLPAKELALYLEGAIMAAELATNYGAESWPAVTS